MKMPTLSSALLLLVAATAAFGASVNPCPQAKPEFTGAISNASNATYESNVATQGTCNLVITFNADGSIVTVTANTAPYDGAEDQLIGVVNNSLSPVTTIHLSNPGAGIFAFDAPNGGVGDGICAYTPFASNAQPCNFDAISGSYLGSGSSFSGINVAEDTGNVNFAGIAPGSTGYFSLEGPASLNLQVNSPEPASLGTLGGGLALMAFMARRKRAIERR